MEVHIVTDFHPYYQKRKAGVGAYVGHQGASKETG